MLAGIGTLPRHCEALPPSHHVRSALLASAAIEKDRPRLLLSDPHLSFIMGGGFVYMDATMKLIGANALAAGVGK